MDKQLELLESINSRLGVMIYLLLRVMPREGATTSLKEQVKILSNRNIRPRDIAEILGRTPSHINKELVGIRKELKKRE